MEAETKVRLLFVCPCGINVSGSPIDAKADVQIHRENCRTCAGINYVNTLQVPPEFAERTCHPSRSDEYHHEYVDSLRRYHPPGLHRAESNY